jgi:hypothetical protein
MKLPPIAPAFPPVLRRVALIMTAMMLASLLFTNVMTWLLHAPHPYGWVWIGGPLQWCDFHAFQERSFHFRTDSYWLDYDYPMTYPATVAVIFALFYKLPHPLKVYFAILFLGWLGFVVWMARGLARRGIPADQAAAFGLIVLATSWPAYYQFDTANIEGLMAIILFVGVVAVLRGWSWSGTALIALAGAMKLFPAVMLALLFSKRRYKEFAFGVVLMGILNYGSLALLGPSISVAQSQIRDGFRFLRNNFITPRGSIQLNFSHALYMPVKFVVLLVDRLVRYGGQHGPAKHEIALVDTTLTLYMFAMAVLGLTLYFRRIRKLPMLNQVVALTVCALVLTPFSSDYTLNHMLLPFSLLAFYAVEAWRQRRSVPGLDTSFNCLCLVLGFATFFTLHYAFSNTVRCFALCLLLVTVMRFPFYWAQLDMLDNTGSEFAPISVEASQS